MHVVLAMPNKLTPITRKWDAAKHVGPLEHDTGIKLDSVGSFDAVFL